MPRPVKGGAVGLVVEITEFAERGPCLGAFGAGAAEDDVILNLNLQNLAGFDQGARNFDIRFGGRWISAGMIMGEDDGGGPEDESGFENFARVDQQRVEGAVADNLEANRPQPSVEAHHD